jgi:hypothetical protein
MSDPAKRESRMVAGLRLSRRFPGYEPGVKILHYPARNESDLVPLNGARRSQVMSESKASQMDRVGNAPTCCSHCK